MAATASLDTLVEGAVNLRDVGGHRTPAGVVRVGIVFRAGMTHHVTSEGLLALSRELGVRTVIDFRAARELADDGLADFDAPGIRHVHLPIGGGTAVIPEEREQRFAAFRSGPVAWAEVYEQLISTGTAAYRQFFEVLCEDDALPAVFHCTAGRDRTGLAAALLLATLGVGDDEIARDYALSGERLMPHMHRLERTRLEMGMATDEFERFIATTEEPIRDFLGRLRRDHGSVVGYLASIGVTERTFDLLRHRLVEVG